MKKIEAIIKPFKLDEVKEALQGVGVQGLTVAGGQGLRPPEGPHRALPGRRVRRRLRAQAEARGGRRRRPWSRAVIEAIQTAANTGKIGDGKIFVSEVLDAIRIRTGETGPQAI